MLGSIPGEDSKLFFCLALVTRQSTFVEKVVVIHRSE